MARSKFDGTGSMESLKKRVAAELAEDREVILKLGENADPERILKLISFFKGNYEIELVVRHAELQEYLEHALTGAAVGAGVGAAGAMLTALAYGSPLSFAALLAAAGLGAVAGALVGAAVTPLHRVTVYRYGGQTLLKVARLT